MNDVLEQGLKPLSIKEFKTLMRRDDVILLDTRESTVFADGFIQGAISIGLDGRFAEWAGSLLPFDKSIILVTEEGKEKESVVRLARVGFDKMEGYLKGGFEAWKNSDEIFDLIINIEADELAMDIPFDPNLVVLDVRAEQPPGLLNRFDGENPAAALRREQRPESEICADVNDRVSSS